MIREPHNLGSKQKSHTKELMLNKKRVRVVVLRSIWTPSGEMHKASGTAAPPKVGSLSSLGWTVTVASITSALASTSLVDKIDALLDLRLEVWQHLVKPTLLVSAQCTEWKHLLDALGTEFAR